MGGYVGARAGSLLATTAAEVQDLTATDTTPEVTIVNSTHEDTDGGREGKVTFKGQQSGGEETTLAQIQASHDGTSDDEKGDLIFKTNDGSDGSSPTERVRIDSAGHVGIGAAPTYDLDISGEAIRIKNTSGTGYIIDQNANSSVSHILYENSFMRFGTNSAERMRIDSNGHVSIGGISTGMPFQVHHADEGGMRLIAPDGAASFFEFGDASDSDIGRISYDHADNHMAFRTSNAERMRILAGGGLTFNGDTATANALSDYEEGTMTMTLNTTGNAPSVNEGRTFTGYYTKVGQLVNCWGYTGARVITGAGTGIAKVTGLPFTINDAYGVGTLTHCTMFASGGNTTAYLATSTDAFFPLVTAGTSGVAYVTGTRYMMFHVVYRTNS